MKINITNFIKSRPEIIFFLLLIFISISLINVNNFQRTSLLNNYNDLINNVFFQKTPKNLINNLDPKFKTVKYKIQKGDTISKILSDLNIKEIQIEEIKKKLSKEIDISKMLEDNQNLFCSLIMSLKDLF